MIQGKQGLLHGKLSAGWPCHLSVLSRSSRIRAAGVGMGMPTYTRSRAAETLARFSMSMIFRPSK
jgi:hypothetical protein